jgi:hypothetical protein
MRKSPCRKSDRAVLKILNVEVNSWDQVLDWLEEIGWSIAEAGSNTGWKAFAIREEVRFEGAGPRRADARRDLIYNMLQARTAQDA